MGKGSDKKRITFKKATALLLALVMLLGTCLIGGSDNAYAFDIDSSGFSDPTITTTVVYYWHKGMPPTDKVYDKADLENMYPLLITWDDTYYWCCDNQFWNSVQGNNQSISALDWKSRLPAKDAYWGLDIGKIVGYSIASIISPFAGVAYLLEQYSSNYLDVDRGNSTEGTPSHVRHMNRRYSMSENGLISNLKLDFDTLKSTGTAVSFSIPNLPMAVCAMEPTPVKESDGSTGSAVVSTVVQAMESLRLAFLNENTSPIVNSVGHFAIYVPNNYGTGSYKNLDYYPLVGVNSFENRRIEVSQWFGLSTEANYNCSWDWYLDMIPDYYRSRSGNNWIDDFLKNVEFKGLQRGVHSNEGVDPRNIPLRNRLWDFEEHSDGKFTISTPSIWESVQLTWVPKKNKGDIQEFIRKHLGDSRSEIHLYHTPNILLSSGWSGIDNMTDSLHNLKTMPGDSFDIYYGEPVIMNFIQTSFTVQNGQVTNLDGPIAIADGVTITVEDGGVLSTTDWIINNGTIVVEPGGTLLVQENTTENNETRYGVIAPLVDNGGLTGGRIICDGRMIVMPNCKVAGGGKYGLVFGEGSQCVNYGALISENFEVYTDHTIENRGDDSIVVFGTGVGDSYPLLTLPVSWISETYKHREPAFAVNTAKDAVYGKGAERIEVHAGASFQTAVYNRDRENKSGTAVSNMPRIALKSSIDVEEGATIYKAGAERTPENELVTLGVHDKVQTYNGGDVVVLDSNQITKGEYSFGNETIVAVNSFNEVIFSGLIERWDGKDNYAAPVAAEYTAASAGKIYAENDYNEPLAEFSAGATVTVHEGKRVFITSGGTTELYRIADQDVVILNSDNRVLWSGRLAGWDGVDPATISKYPAQYVSTSDYTVYTESEDEHAEDDSDIGGGVVAELLTDIPEGSMITLNAFGDCTISYKVQTVLEIEEETPSETPEGETPSGEAKDTDAADLGGELVTVEFKIDGRQIVEIYYKAENEDGASGTGSHVYSGEFRNWTPNR